MGASYRCMALRPERFVQRHQLDELVALLCAAADSPAYGASVAITTALQGAGGFGKTTLAQALCYDDRVRRAYPDGILWITLGEQPSDAQLLGHVFDLIRWAGSEPTEYSDVNKAGAELRERLAGRRVLLVVDDAWRISDLALFRDVGAAMLVTTRDRQILPADCTTIAVDVMAAGEATALLGRDLHADDAGGGMVELAARLGCWPLLLDLVNRQLRELVADGMSLREAITEVTHLLDGEGMTAFDLDNDKARSTAVARTMAVGLRCLDNQDRELYRMLAVFPEDAEIPLGTLACYWGVVEGKARKLCHRLYGRAMLQRFDRTARTIRLHDVFRRYLIDVQGDGMPALHRRWLDVFHPRSGRWSELPQDERHAWQWLAYHLRGAGESKTLRSLLLDYDWLDARLRAADPKPRPDSVADGAASDRGGPAELIGDFAYVDNDQDVRLVRDALRLSSHVLARNPSQLASQLVGRLMSFEDREAISQLLAQARGESRCAWLCPLTPSLAPPGGPLVRTLVGHANSVTSVAVSPEGKYAISASEDHTLKVWDLASGRELRTLHGHLHSVWAVAVMPDGKRAISASGDHTLKVWDLASGCELRTLHGHSRAVMAVAVTPDGAQAISASQDHTLKVWDLASGCELRTLHTRSYLAVAVTPDGKRAISASDDNTLKVWDLASGRELRTLAGHSDSVEAVAVTTDGARAISASSDKTLKVWDLASGRELRIMYGHSDSVWAVAVTPDGAHVISASEDNTLKVWDLASGRELRTLHGRSCSVAVTPDGAHAISASADDTLKVWDLASGWKLRTMHGHSDWVRAVAVTPDSARAVSASSDNTLKVWDLVSGRELLTLHGHSDWVMAVAVTPDGARAISASQDHTLKVWDLASGRELRTMHGHSRPIHAVAVTPDGAHAISASQDHTLKVWDLASGRELRTLHGHSDSIDAVTVTPDGAQAISASYDGTLKVWELASGCEIRALRGHHDRVKAVAVTPDGTHAISASRDCTLKVWDLASGCEIRTLHGHYEWVRAVVVTPDGLHAISESWDHALKVWDLASGRELRILRGHSNEVWAVAVTPDGTHAVSVSWDHTINIWDLSSGRVFASFTGEGSMLACAYEPHSGTIVAGDSAGHVHFLRLVEPTAPAYPVQPSAAPLSMSDPGALMSHDIDDQPWNTSLPIFDSVCRDELLTHAGRAPVLLVVVTDIERQAVLRFMQPLTSDSGNRRLKGYIGQQSYYCGTFGAYRAVLTTCEMGSIGRDAAILSVQQAITDLSPGCVIMVGIAFGKDPKKQHVGQVLVASQIVSYEQQRAGADIVPRGPRAESDGILKNRFRTLDHWHFSLPDGRACKRDIGPILSGEKLIDDAAFKARLFAAFPDAIGGEMEGAGLYAAAARARVPWILVKGICDWADGTKTDHAQPLAAATAASLVHAVLSEPYALDGIAGTEPTASAARPPSHGLGATRTPGHTADLMQADEDRLVEALMDCMAMRDPAQRALVLDRLDRDIQVRIGGHETLFVHFTKIVKTCAAYAGGLEQLLDALAHVEGRSRAVQQVAELIGRLVGGHF